MFDLITQAVAQAAIGLTPISIDTPISLPPTPTVEVTNLISTVIQGIGVMLLTAVAAWVRSHLNDVAAQKTVLTAAENAVAYAENRLGVKGDQPYTVPVASAIGRMALGYMNAHVAQAAKQMGLDDAGLSRIIIAKMPDVKDGGIDQGTYNNIVASASGKAPAPTDYSQLLAVLGPAIKQAALEAYTEHYATAKPGDKPVIVPDPVVKTSQEGVG